MLAAEPTRGRRGSPAPEPPEPEAGSCEPAAASRAGSRAGARAARRQPAPAAAAGRAQPPTRTTDDDDGGQGASYVTPLVRRLAAEHDVDLADVTGTGVGGRIRKQDVLDAAGQRQVGAAAQPAADQPRPHRQRPDRPRPQPAARRASGSLPTAAPGARRSRRPARGSTEKLSRLRQVIAERMTESLQISAQLTTVVEADLTKIARLRERAKADFEAREGVKLTYLPFFALATCEALREHPVVNSSIDLEAGTVTYHDSVHLGIAVDTPRGLLVPVLKDASDLNLAGIARKVDDLAARTRENHITPDELGGGTFTLTNTGSRGALFDTPIINQPQVGILGTGAVVKRAGRRSTTRTPARSSACATSSTSR